ncbi:MAG: efflux RND transporter permease subunit [Candidatus Hinthialibacter antarcticus]|nr:efflux RND transporter permease subunit [Candidatus Hinthialibacter antarcticus]
MKLVEGSIQQPITVTVCVILALLAGFVALNRVPIQLTPEIEDTVIAVTTTWENASPQEVETEIVDEQEERLQGVSNLRLMTSVSQRGQGEIRLEFQAGTNKDVALREVSDKLREVPAYPLNVDEPVVSDTDPQSRDYVAWLLVACDNPDYDVTKLYDVLDKRMKPQFERLSGVAEVNVLGGREREVQIRVDPVLLAQYGITFSQLADAINITNQNYSGGALVDGKSDVRVRSIGRYSQIEQTKNTVIKQDEAGPVYIRDVADVVETYKEQAAYVRSRGIPVLAINFQREIGANVLDVMKNIHEEIDRMSLPGGLMEVIANSENVGGKLRLVQVYDQTTYIDHALSLVQENIFLGGGLAIITLLLFLRSLRSIGIIAIAIPISIIGSIVLLYAMGRTVNVISLAGMAFAVGMVVDNSIVVLENIYRHLEMGKSVRQSALEGAQEVAGAVLASTLTTLIVFIPILLIEEQAGQLFRDIALAICAAVGISFIVAITVIPSASALFLRNRDYSKKPTPSLDSKRGSGAKVFLRVLFFFIWLPYYLFTHFSEIVSSQVRYLSNTVFLRLAIIAIFAVVTITGAYFLLPPIDYLPQGNRNIIFGMLIPPPGYNLEKLSSVGKRIEARIRPFWQQTEAIFEFEKGNMKPDPDSLVQLPASPMPGAPLMTPPAIKNYFLVASNGAMFHGAISDDDEKVVDIIPLFQYATASDVAPGFIGFAFQLPLFRIGGTTGSAVNIDLSGPNLSQVSGAAGALFGNIVAQYGPYSLQPEPSNFNVPSPELQVLPNLIKLTDMGLTPRDIGLAVQVNADGAFVGEYEVEGERIDLVLISKDASTKNELTDLLRVPLSTPDGANVTLESVADFNRTVRPDQIKRVARQRAVTLQFTPPPGMPLQNAIDDIGGMIEQLQTAGQIPPEVQINLTGSASKLGAMQTALLGDGTFSGMTQSSLFLALLVVYLLMCVLFQSWVYPLVIMVTVPLATFGGLLTLAGVHYWSLIDRHMPIQNMDVLTILGFVILAGVVVNNAILIVHQTLNFLTTDSNMDPKEAIAQATESRVRPIMMSTLTSVGGMAPLVLMPGAGSELYRGLGSVVVGGLLVSTVFTLVLIPLVLSVVFDIQRMFTRQ